MRFADKNITTISPDNDVITAINVLTPDPDDQERRQAASGQPGAGRVGLVVAPIGRNRPDRGRHEA